MDILLVLLFLLPTIAFFLTEQSLTQWGGEAISQKDGQHLLAV